jgi:hypothetical protein
MKTLTIALMALASATLASGSAAGASILVTTASGNVGEFSFLNTGISAGTATILVSVPSITSTIDTANGAILTPPVITSVNTPITLLVTPQAGGLDMLALAPGDYLQTVGAIAGQQAQLSFNLSSGTTPATLPAFFNASGPVTHLLLNANPTLDFGQFSTGLGSINFTFTATSFSGTASFAGLFTTPGASAVGNGSFSERTVPAPASAVLLGLGLVLTTALCFSRP